MKKQLKIKLSFSIILLFLLTFLFSCEYDTNDVFINPTNKNVTPPIIETINLDFNSNDTIFIYCPDIINFSFESSNQEIETVILTIDNNHHEEIQSKSGVFSINNYNLSVGNHTLKIEVLTKTGTGSIAESLDCEHFAKSKTWILVNSKLNTLINKTFSNGFQKLYWTKCKSQRLIEYVVYCDNDELTTVNSNYYIDSSYLGDHRLMSIKVRLEGNVLLDWGMIQIEDDLPKLNFKATNFNEYTIYWNKPKYYNAIDTFKVLVHLFYDTRNVCLKKTTNINDTSVVIDKSYFGCYIFTTCQLIPKKSMFNYTYGRYEVYKSFVTGLKFCPFRKVFPINNDSCIVDASDSVLRYSIPNKLFIDKIKRSTYGFMGDVCVSSQGKYLTSSMELNNYSTNFWALTNALQNYTTISLPDQKFVSVSDNGLVASLYDYHTINIYNLINSEKLASYYSESMLTSDFRFSSDGQYLLVRDNSLYLFQFKDNQLNLVQKTSDFRFFEFDSKHADQYVTWNGSKVFIKKLPTNIVINEFSLTDYRICNIDFYNNEMLTYSNGHLYVRNLNDGSIIFNMESKIDDVYIEKECYLQNHIIFCDSGVLYNLNSK